MLKAFVSGIFPRQDELIGAINRYEKGRIVAEELYSVYRKCEGEWLETQKGLTWISEPSLSWNDIFRPFTLNLKNVETGPLTRYLETNTFYRRPVFRDYPVSEIDILKLTNEYGLPFIHEKGVKVMLPGPYTFVKSGELSPHLDEWRLIHKVADIIFDQASRFNFVEFKEPLVRDTGILKSLNNIYSTFSGKGYISTGIHENNTVDFSVPYTVNSMIRDPPDNVILGIVDVFSTRVEEFTNLTDGVTITTNESLEFLPYIIARKKVEYMKNLLEVK